MQAVNQYYRALSRGMAPVIPPVISTFGSVTAGGTKWAGGALAGNGKIYCAPYGSTSVLVIDPATDTISTFGSLAGSDKWAGAILAPNGYIYCIPFSSTSILKIDPATNTATTFGSLSGTQKWLGGVLADDGKIYGIPHNSTTVLEIDPATDTATTFGSLSGSGKWRGGVLASNGYIYGIPSNSSTVLKINTVSKSVSTFGSLGAGSAKWSGGFLANNGFIYAFPILTSTVLKINPSADTAATIGTISGSLLSVNSCFAPNLKGYWAPYNSQYSLELDPSVDSLTSQGSLTAVSARCYGLVLAGNGCLYGVPHAAADILKISNLGSPTSGMVNIPSPISGLSASVYNRHQNKF